MTESGPTYDILYDDGDHEHNVPRSRIKVASSSSSSSSSSTSSSTSSSSSTELAVEARVMANWKGRGQYYPGKIVAVHACSDDTSSESSSDDDR